jgi:hypothetical protein
VLCEAAAESAQRTRVAQARQDLRGAGVPSTQHYAHKHVQCFACPVVACSSLMFNASSVFPHILVHVIIHAHLNVEFSFRHVQDAPEKVIKAYAEAVQTVDPIKADGKPHTLWVAFARCVRTYLDCMWTRVA